MMLLTPQIVERLNESGKRFGEEGAAPEKKKKKPKKKSKEEQHYALSAFQISPDPQNLPVPRMAADER